MDSRTNQDKISSLPDFILVLIISTLPLNQAVKTSLLSKRWRNLYRKSITNDIVFKESDFTTCYASDDEETKKVTRVSFICFMLGSVLRLSAQAIESFDLYISKPMGFEIHINSLMEFAVSKQIKNLVLDFSDPSWTTNDEASVVQLPECVYNLINLESLKLFACGFDPSRLTNPGSLKVLSFGWIQLKGIMSLISTSPMLESLSIQNCWDIGLEMITGYNNRLRELVFENCDFSVPYSTLELPNILIFKYSGKVHYFEFLSVNRIMTEAYLDFGAETEYDDGTGTQLCGLLYDLLSARTLTVCPFLIQLIQDGEDPVRLRQPMETRHLVMKTNLLPNEFVGIRLMINGWPDLETLTFQMVAPRPVPVSTSAIAPDTYWKFNLNHRCLKKTLKVVELKNFTGGSYELHVLEFLIRFGRVLERVDLYLPNELEESQKLLASAEAQKVRTFEKASEHLSIILHNG
ncbi:PREDICTED: F-box protein At3g62230-like [Camelina sativa]|uniref:F-box protein At3g62230-like n=1 Tax=Camelina sativa TaxID=90675 RepID=A0ABM0TUE5_CAMSA|nr:PREDICTED: F-box protein At3g62230-like [Camelina sativa]